MTKQQLIEIIKKLNIASIYKEAGIQKEISEFDLQDIFNKSY